MTLLTHTTCTKITRRDLTVEGTTSHDQDLTVDSQLYRSVPGYTPSSIQSTVDLEPDNIDQHGIIDEVYVREGDLRAGEYNGARIEVILADWKTSTKVRTLLVGFLGRFRIINQQYKLEINLLESEYGKPIGETYSLNCQVKRFGDSRCKYAVPSVSSDVNSVAISKRSFVDLARVEADDYFNDGLLTWTSGANAGRQSVVKRYTLINQTIELYEPTPSVIAVSDAFDLEQGCPRTWAFCKSIGNQLNYRGQPYFPGFSDIVGDTGGA